MSSYHHRSSSRSSTSHALSVLVVLLATVLSIIHSIHAQSNNGCVDLALFGPKLKGSKFEWNVEGDKLNGMVLYNRDNKLDAGWIAFGIGSNLQYGMSPSDIMLIWKVDGVIKHSMKQGIELVGKPHQANGTIFENDLSVVENDDGTVTVKFSKKFTYDTPGSMKLKDETMAFMVAMHTSKTPQGENAEVSWFIHQYNRKYTFNPLKISNNCDGSSPGPTPGPGPNPGSSEPSPDPSSSTPPPATSSPSPSPLPSVSSPSPQPKPTVSTPIGEPSESVSVDPPSAASTGPIAGRSSTHGHVSEAMITAPKLIISACVLLLTVMASVLFTKHY